METQWSLEVTSEAFQELKSSVREDQINAAAILNAIGNEGWEWLDYDVDEGVLPPTWDEEFAPIVLTAYAYRSGPFYKLVLEILPGRLVKVRSIRRGGTT